jgi:hypothetical protein
MRLGEAHHLVDGAVEHQRIGIQQQNVTSFRHRDALVIGGGKAAVVGVRQENRLRKRGLNHVHRAIRGGVVDYDHLEFHVLGLLVDRPQTIAQDLACVPVHDDDGDGRRVHIRTHRQYACCGRATTATRSTRWGVS